MATGVLGTIAVDYIARTKKFTQGGKRVRDDMGRTGKAAASTSKMVGGLGRVFSTLGLSLTAGGVISAFNSTRKSIDELAKTSDKLGVTTEQLGALSFAAQQNGVSATQLATGIQRMTRRISEAAAGTGVLVKPLEEMGLNVDRLNKLDPARQFEEIAAALNKVPKEDRIRRAFSFFDSEGVGLLNLAGKDLKAYADEAERLGALVSRGEAKKIEEFNESLARVGAAFKGTTARIVVEVSKTSIDAINILGRLQQQVDIISERAGAGKGVVGKTADAAVGFANRINPAQAVQTAFRDLAGFLETAAFEGKKQTRSMESIERLLAGQTSIPQ